MKSDHELMISVRDGRVAELGALFERHNARIYNFFLRMTRDRQASEDLVQEAFVRILKYRHTYRSDGEFVTWFYRLARNAANDHFRKLGRTLDAVSADEEAVVEPVCEQDLPLAKLESGESAELLRTALDRLPEDKREVLILTRFHGLKHEQIGEILGCKVGAVKVRVHRAVKQLRDVYLTLLREASGPSEPGFPPSEVPL